MKSVQIFTKSTCPYCNRVKEFFNSKKIPFEEVDLSNNSDELAALKRKTGLLTVPQVFIDNELIGGCDDILRLDSEGRLFDILNG